MRTKRKIIEAELANIRHCSERSLAPFRIEKYTTTVSIYERYFCYFNFPTDHQTDINFEAENPTNRHTRLGKFLAQLKRLT